MNLLKDIGNGALQVLKTVAPTLATAAAGPFAPLVVPLINKVFGIDASDSKVVSAALLTATPDQLLALQKEEDGFKVTMEQLRISEEQLSFNDLASARQMQIATKDPTASQLAWLIIGGFLVVSLAQLVAILGWADQVNKIPPQGWLLIGNISGYLANEAKQAAAFYFGSSASSQAKDATLADIAKQP